MSAPKPVSIKQQNLFHQALEENKYLYIDYSGEYKVAGTKKELRQNKRGTQVTDLQTLIEEIGATQWERKNDLIKKLKERVEAFEKKSQSTSLWSWITRASKSHKVHQLANRVFHFADLYLNKAPGPDKPELKQDFVVGLCKKIHQGQILVFNTESCKLETITPELLRQDQEGKYLTTHKDIFNQAVRFYSGSDHLISILLVEQLQASYYVKNEKKIETVFGPGVRRYLRKSGMMVDPRLSLVLDIVERDQEKTPDFKMTFYTVLKDRIETFRERELKPKSLWKRITLVFRKSKIEETAKKELKVLELYLNPPIKKKLFQTIRSYNLLLVL
jgi:hypothetical protein